MVNVMKLEKEITDIDYIKTKKFFDNRSEKYTNENPYSVTMYQDNNKELVKKVEYTQNVELTLDTIVSKNIHSQDEVSLVFYDNYGNIINKYTVEYGSYLVYEDFIPIKEEDQKYKEYEFRNSL